jgi:hypothetical protein
MMLSTVSSSRVADVRHPVPGLELVPRSKRHKSTPGVPDTIREVRDVPRLPPLGVFHFGPYPLRHLRCECNFGIIQFIILSQRIIYIKYLVYNNSLKN